MIHRQLAGRLILLLCVLPLLLIALVAGLIAGPVLAIAWLNAELHRSWANL
jgi:hypothetical protein